MPRLYVGRLPNRVSERDIEKFFKGFGRLREINLKNGYGFVDFEDQRDADDAAYDLNGRELMGDRIIVEHAKGIERTASNGFGLSRSSAKPRSRTSDRYGPPLKTHYRLSVENLSTRVSWQDLKDYCRQAGEVTYADAHKDRKREAVVCFATKEDMKNVIRKLEGTELNGRKIHFVEERRSRSNSRSPPPRRKRSRSASRSRSLSRSRSPRHSRSRSRSRSRSPAKRSRRRSSHSRSRSVSRSRSRSKSRTPSRSRSRSAPRSDRSRSASQQGDRGEKEEAPGGGSPGGDGK